MAYRDAAAPLVELRDVRKSFGDNVVLDEVDLAIAPGEAIVIAGPSGSGKSTMLRGINGLEEVDSGSVTFDGRAVDPRSKSIGRMRADIGMVFQQFNLFPHSRPIGRQAALWAGWRAQFQRREGAQPQRHAPAVLPN
jgi:glutamate transport system ATP-binding protein